MRRLGSCTLPPPDRRVRNTRGSDTREAYRRTFIRWCYVGSTAVYFFLCLSFVFDNFDIHTHAPPSLPQRVVASALCGVGLLLAFRQFRSGIFPSDDGVEFRNFVRTYRMPWNTINHFEHPPTYGTWRFEGLRAYLRNGQVRSSALYAPGPLNRRAFADPVVTRLNALLALARQGGGRLAPTQGDADRTP